MADTQSVERLRAGTHALVDLDAYASNIGAVRALLPVDTALMAVVKADAYGHGAVECAGAALHAGAEWLGVARADEALRLRRAGVSGAVLVLGPPNPLDLPDAIAHDITLSVGSESSLAAVMRCAAQAGTRVSVHLKIDTGMRRYGFLPEDALAIAQQLAAAPAVHLDGVYTHFASADEDDVTPTEAQLARFHAVLEQLESAGLMPRWTHAANSAGILSGRTGRTNLARAGIATFGLSPSSEVGVDDRFWPVLSVHSRLARVSRLRIGEGVSYGLTYRAPMSESVGVVPIGYADGLPRALSNRGVFGVQGERCPIRGRVCMDQTVIAVPASAREGDAVVVLGEGGMTADEIARLTDTINYEIVARTAARVPRVYLEHGRVSRWRVPADCASGATG